MLNRMNNRWNVGWLALALIVSLFGRSMTPSSMVAAPATATVQEETLDESADSWNTAKWEPFKIALAAFYAICMQRGFETVIPLLRDHPLSLDVHILSTHLDPAQWLIIIQTTAYSVWITLFFVSNSALYLRISRGRYRRVAAHGVLTLAFSFFYFLGATLGTPSRSQLLLIAVIIVLDATLPVVFGTVLGRGPAMWWAFRATVQTTIGVLAYTKLTEEMMRDPMWSLAWLALMLIQLFVLAPLEHELQSRE